MTWAKHDDGRHENPKLLRAGLEADGLHARMTTYSARHETDGFVDEIVVEGIARVRHWRKVIDILVCQELAIRDDERGGWWVNDYLHYNPSRADLESKRERDRRRKDSGRTTQGIQRESARNPRGVRTDSSGPDPTRPDPYSDAEASSSGEDDEELAEALWRISTDRLAQRVAEVGKVTMVPAWIAKTTSNLRIELSESIIDLPVGLSASEIVERLQPKPAPLGARIPIPRSGCDECAGGFFVDDDGTAWPCSNCRAAS